MIIKERLWLYVFSKQKGKIMSTNLVYCINCDEKNPYTVSFRRVGRNVHGITFNYVEQIAYCSICGEEIYVAEINDTNVESLNEAYRNASNMNMTAEIN